MDAEEYVREQESRLVTASVDQTRPTPPVTGTGTIICTDSRLVFDTAKSITDIRLDSISEIDYSPPTYLNRVTVAGALGTFLGAILWVLFGMLLPVAQPIAILALIFGVISLLFGILMRKATLVIKTSSSKYRFRGDNAEIATIPHAIRGADRN